MLATLMISPGKRNTIRILDSFCELFIQDLFCEMFKVDLINV